MDGWSKVRTPNKQMTSHFEFTFEITLITLIPANLHATSVRRQLQALS